LSSLKAILLISFLFLFFLSAHIVFGQGTNGLVAHWQFSGNAADSSGNGLHGIATGTTPTAGYTGIMNTALQFNGSGDHIDVPYNSLMNVDSFSICVLIKPLGYYSGSCQANFILYKGIDDGTDSGAYCFQFNDETYDNDNCATFEPDKEQFVCQAFAGSWRSNRYHISKTVDTGKWYCVVSTYDRDSMKIYIDGVLSNAIPWNNIYSPSGSNIGIGYYKIGTPSGYPFWYNGIIDDIRLYDRALTPMEALIYCDSAKMSPTIVINDSLNIISTDAGCSTFRFFAVSKDSTITSYNWDFGDGATGTGNPVSHSYLHATTYTVYVITTNKKGEKVSAFYTTIAKSPSAITITQNNKYQNCKYHGLQLKANGAAYYSWQPATLCNNPLTDTPVVIFTTPTQLFTVTGTDSNGCISYDTINVHKFEEPSLTLPSAFSPNGDGVNDVLYVRGNNFNAFFLAVYNRWGNEVFSTNNIGIGWDGTYKGHAQPVETYAYILKIITTDGCEEVKTGSVILLH